MKKEYKHDKLSSEEINRYSRHLILPEVGLEGQLKIKNSKVFIEIEERLSKLDGH